MISIKMKTLYRWLLETAEVALSWLRRKYPVSWERGLYTLQQLTAGPMRKASYVQMRRLPFIVGTALVVYLVASSTLMQLLVVFMLGIGVFLVLQRIANGNIQEASPCPQ